MKFLTALSTLLLAASCSPVSARSSLFGADLAPSPLEDDPDFLVPGSNPLKHCSDPKDDILDLQSVDLDPNPPQAGQNLSIIATGTLNRDVEEGAKIHLSVKYGLITIIKTTVDLCANADKVNLTCPLHKDEKTTLTKEVAIPKEIPPGKYTVRAEVVTKDEEAVTCLTAFVEFKREKKEGGGAGQKVLGGLGMGL